MERGNAGSDEARSPVSLPTPQSSNEPGTNTFMVYPPVVVNEVRQL